jgi:hypothetical protein
MNKQLRCTGDQHGWKIACNMVWELRLHNSVFNLVSETVLSPVSNDQNEMVSPGWSLLPQARTSDRV